MQCASHTWAAPLMVPGVGGQSRSSSLRVGTESRDLLPMDSTVTTTPTNTTPTSMHDTGNVAAGTMVVTVSLNPADKADTDSIDVAVANVAAAGRAATIFVHVGEYRVAETLVLGNEVRLIGLTPRPGERLMCPRHLPRPILVRTSTSAQEPLIRCIGRCSIIRNFHFLAAEDSAGPQEGSVLKERCPLGCNIVHRASGPSTPKVMMHTPVASTSSRPAPFQANCNPSNPRLFLAARQRAAAGAEVCAGTEVNANMCVGATSTSSQIGVGGRHTGVTHSPTSLRLDRRDMGGAHTWADEPAQAYPLHQPPPMSPLAASARHDGEGESRRGTVGAAGAEAAMAESSPIGGHCSREEEGGSKKRKRSWHVERSWDVERSWHVDMEAEAELKQLLTQADAHATAMHGSMRCKCPVY